MPAYSHLQAAIAIISDWDDPEGEDIPGIEDLDYMIDSYLEGNINMVQEAISQMSEREAALAAMYMYEEIGRIQGDQAAKQFMTALH